MMDPLYEEAFEYNHAELRRPLRFPVFVERRRSH